MKQRGLRERFYGWASGKLLLKAGRLATKRGDIHEAAHCIQALFVGNSSPGTHDNYPCEAELALKAIQSGDVDVLLKNRKVT